MTENATTRPEVVKGGLFSSSYIKYSIKTEPMGWLVKRTFSDIVWLRSTLQKIYPGLIVPPIPKQKVKKTNNEFVTKRKSFLERFFNDLLEHPELRNSKILFYFLSIQDEKKFKHAVKVNELKSGGA